MFVCTNLHVHLHIMQIFIYTDVGISVCVYIYTQFFLSCLFTRIRTLAYHKASLRTARHLQPRERQAEDAESGPGSPAHSRSARSNAEPGPELARRKDRRATTVFNALSAAAKAQARAKVRAEEDRVDAFAGLQDCTAVLHLIIEY